VSSAMRPGQYLEWKTLPVPADAMKQDTYTFYWIGNTARFSEIYTPKSARFMLALNGKDIVEFHIPKGKGNEEWKGQEGVKLTFEHRSNVRSATQGTFRLTVPTTLLKTGEPATLRVHAPKGNHGGVWFGIFEACKRKPRIKE